MAQAPVLQANSRAAGSKGATRALRRQKQVPCVVYGGGLEPAAVAIPANELLKTLKKGKFLSTLFELQVEGKSERVIAREVQRDVVKDQPIHVDFLRLSEGSIINLMIPVEFINEDDSPGLKRGGVLNIVRHEVEMRVPAGNIPGQITADLAGLDIGGVVHISDIDLPEGSSPLISDRDFVIATIAAPSVLTSAEEAGEEAEEAEIEEEEAEAADGESEEEE